MAGYTDMIANCSSNRYICNRTIHNYQAGQAPFPLRYHIIRKGEVGWVGAGLILTLQRPRKKLSDFREQIRDYRFWPQEFKTVGIFSISFFLFARFGIFSIFLTVYGF